MKTDTRVFFSSRLLTLFESEQECFNTGCYQLFLKLSENKIIQIGALGPRWFQGGIYIYSGSGRKHLFQRIERHLSFSKKKFWHIDYLSSYSDFLFLDIMIYFSTESECFFHQLFQKFAGAHIPVPGFGSTDCKKGCGSHLLFLKSEELIVLSNWQEFLHKNYRQLKYRRLSDSQ